MEHLEFHGFFPIFAASSKQNLKHRELETVIIDFLKGLFGNAAFIGGFACVALVGGALWLAWWGRGIKEKISKVDDHEQHMNEFRDAVARINNLPCANHEHNIDRHDQEHRDMNTRLTRVETSVEFLQKSVEDLTKNLQVGDKKLILGSYTQSRSPLSITDKGREMMQRVGMGEMFERNWDRIERLINEGVEDKNAYDIDQFCMEQAVVFPGKFLGREDIGVLKDDAYEQGMSLTSYMRVVAILARNRYLEEHPVEAREPVETV